MQNLDLTNHFLIAMPALQDPNFHQTVTYVCAHSADGALGIVVNRLLDMPLGQVLSQMQLTPNDPEVNDWPVFQGGPVQRDRGFVLHRPVGVWGSTLRVSELVGLATSRDILEAVANGTGPLDVLVALGYAGWDAGQLEQEMADNAWLSTPADPAILFEVPPERRWQRAARQMGIDLQLLSSDIGHA
jgi:putative transcriptional regulator